MSSLILGPMQGGSKDQSTMKGHAMPIFIVLIMPNSLVKCCTGRGVKHSPPGGSPACSLLVSFGVLGPNYGFGDCCGAPSWVWFGVLPECVESSLLGSVVGAV